MPKLEDVYNGKIDFGNIDEAWLHDQDPSRYHMVFGGKDCGCNEYEDAEMEYYHECYPDEFHERFGYDFDYCGCDKKISFRKEDPEYGCFSNFYPSPVDMDGEIYPTSEHYYQAMKAESKEEQDHIKSAPTPHESRNRGKACQLRDGWNEIRDEIMLNVVMAKFQQHSNLAAILLSTGNAELIEWAPWDNYWGDGKDGKGKNKLGKILMRVRKHLKEE